MANKPTHIAHSVRDFAKKDGGEDSPWTRIGAGFVHKDGQGFNIVLDALPLSGRVVLRLNKPKPNKE